MDTPRFEMINLLGRRKPRLSISVGHQISVRDDWLDVQCWRVQLGEPSGYDRYAKYPLEQ